MDSPMEILQLIASGVIGYLLGALPFAQWVARYIKGVDIFNTGTTLAGTANVFWNVGRRSALLVFIGDVGKVPRGGGGVGSGCRGAPDPGGRGGGHRGPLGIGLLILSGGDAMTPLIGVSFAWCRNSPCWRPWSEWRPSF